MKEDSAFFLNEEKEGLELPEENIPLKRKRRSLEASAIKNNSYKKTIIISLIVSSFIIFFSLIVLNFIKSEKVPDSQENILADAPSQLSTDDTETTEPALITESKNIILGDWVAPNVISTEKNIVLQNNNFIVSSPLNEGLFVSFEQIVNNNTDKCTLSLPTDFCYLGGTDNNSFYYFNDLAHSKFLESASSFNEISIEGFYKSATTSLIIAGVETSSVILIHEDSSGFIITSNSGFTEKEINSIISKTSFSVEGK